MPISTYIRCQEWCYCHYSRLLWIVKTTPKYISLSSLIISLSFLTILLAIPQVVCLLKNNIINVDADALKRLSEQGKIYNCLIWTSLMTILLDTEFRGLVRRAIPEIIELLWHSEENVRRASSDALLKLAEQGNILSFWSERCWCTIRSRVSRVD